MAQQYVILKNRVVNLMRVQNWLDCVHFFFDVCKWGQ